MDLEKDVERLENPGEGELTKVDTSGHDSGKAAKKLSSEELINLLQMAEKLKSAMRSQDTEALKGMQANKALLMMLAEYLILNLDNENIDTELLPYIQQFLGIKIEKEKDGPEEEREEELTEEQKKHKQRMAIYEIYKATNPNRLAGETALDNFINNTKIHGMGVALQKEGKEYAPHISQDTIKDLEVPKSSFRPGGIKNQQGGGMSR